MMKWLFPGCDGDGGSFVVRERCCVLINAVWVSGS